ncbi:hypothetical protein ACFLW0_01930 [Chloroflexota bacterium]
MTLKYTHLELKQDVAIGIGGYYTPQQELRLKNDGREVLYVRGRAVIESSCCGTGDWIYAIVPGYIVDWQSTENDNGLPVSEVEPIRDNQVQEYIRKTIQANEDTNLIGFW